MHTETLDTPAKITNFTRDVGALGGTLTLKYLDAVVTLTGDGLIFAADDYEFAQFTIVIDELDDVPELTEAEEWSPFVDGLKEKLWTIGSVIGACGIIALLVNLP